MDAMIKSVEQTRKQCAVDGPHIEGPPAELLEASRRWSESSLECFRGELLRKAMLLAAAMAEMAHELQNPS
jgi:hypothetical protein